jgi:hypothetical protein
MDIKAYYNFAVLHLDELREFSYVTDPAELLNSTPVDAGSVDSA